MLNILPVQIILDKPSGWVYSVRTVNTERQMNTYEAALKKSREATRKYMAIRDEYRAGRMSDKDFLAAMAEYKASEKEFDAAYAKAAY